MKKKTKKKKTAKIEIVYGPEKTQKRKSQLVGVRLQPHTLDVIDELIRFWGEDDDSRLGLAYRRRALSEEPSNMRVRLEFLVDIIIYGHLKDVLAPNILPPLHEHKQLCTLFLIVKKALRAEPGYSVQFGRLLTVYDKNLSDAELGKQLKDAPTKIVKILTPNGTIGWDAFDTIEKQIDNVGTEEKEK